MYIHIHLSFSYKHYEVGWVQITSETEQKRGSLLPATPDSESDDAYSEIERFVPVLQVLDTERQVLNEGCFGPASVRYRTASAQRGLFWSRKCSS